MRQPGRLVAVTAIAAACLLAPGKLLGTAARAAGPTLPEIRTHAANQVPACVTPERLMAFLKTRNHKLDPVYRDIARNYKELGEGWRVRWDYAFFQMAIETNFLTYKRPDGRWGDVDPKQYNFAGIGTTGGGVPGNGFPDVKTGVLAQIQHLVAYSGERVAAPTAERTQLKQDDIIEASRALGRPVRFEDLSRRWAVDKNYGRSIEWAADRYRSQFCREGERMASAPPAEPKGEVLPWLAEAEAAPAAGRSKALKGLVWKATPVAKAQSEKAAAEKPAADKKDKPAPRSAASPPAPEPKLVAAPAAAVKPSASVRTVWSRDETSPPAPGMALVSVKTVPVSVGSIETTGDTDGGGKATSSADAAPVDVAMEPAATPAVPEEEGNHRLAGLSGVAAAVAKAAESAPEPAPHATFDPVKNPPSGLGVKPSACRIEAASFGGRKTLLIRTSVSEHTRLTALTVLDGFEKAMTASYLKADAAAAETVGEFASKEAALAKARELCPGS